MPSDHHGRYIEFLVANTWECNLRCRYCFVAEKGVDSAGGRMPESVAARVVEALDRGFPHAETICIHFYGGEPLLHLPAMREMVRRAAQRPGGRFTFALTTNGTVAEPEVFALLEEGRFHVILSIDGPAHIHDQYRRTAAGGPSHALVLRFLEGLRAHTHCRVWGSSVIHSGWSLAEAEAYLHTLGVDEIKAQVIRVPPGSPLALDETERRRYLEDLAGVGRRIIADLEAGVIPRDGRFTGRVWQILRGTPRRRFCNAGVSDFGITPDGTVTSCLLLDGVESRLGSIADDPGVWIRAGAAWADAGTPRRECGECPALPLCGGGCPSVQPLCGRDECEIIRKNCEVAAEIHAHFRERPAALLGLAGIV